MSRAASREAARALRLGGQLARGLDEAASRGWVVASITRDWKTVFTATTQK